MNNICIKTDNLSKQYRIGAHQDSYRTIRETAMAALQAPFRRVGKLLRGHAYGAADMDETIWALKGISFEVRRGEAVGIIGRNGAGKSTLLKVLSCITEPTEGRAEIYGRIGSLLEVGTGFHPELTGRENIFLNGAILGMKRREMLKKFDAIVAFAEIEKFIDTPVKFYSSGMYVRLAFAVAAHLEPEILMVDEVLAVGDAAFQKKCLGRVGDIAEEGRTVLFISHNMAAVTRLCRRAILLDEGRVVKDGPSHEVVSSYLSSGLNTTASREWPDVNKAPGDEIVRLRKVRVRTEDDRTADHVDIRKPVGVELEYIVLKPGHVLVPNLHFYSEEGLCVFMTFDLDSEWRNKPRPAGRYVSTAWVPGNYLSEGSFIVNIAVSTLAPVRVHIHERDAVAFHVIDDLAGDSARGDYAGPMPGVVRPILRWTNRSVPDAG